jgi:hypothetical protein
MDLFNINWNQRAKNDPVVNMFFKEYIFQGEYLNNNKTDIKIKSKKIDTKIQTPKKSDTSKSNESKEFKIK